MSSSKIKRAITLATVAFTATGALAADRSEAKLTVIGGPHAGTHALKVDGVGCEYRKRPSGAMYFNVNFGLQAVKDPKTLSLVLVRIPNADGPGSPPHAGYLAQVNFGDIADRKTNTLYTSGTDNNVPDRQGGTGKVLLKVEGRVANVAFDLQPQAGVSIQGTLTCTIT